MRVVLSIVSFMPLFMPLAGCADGKGPIPPIPGELPPPFVAASLGFGDAPLSGQIVLDPGVVPSGLVPWNYAVDVDEDGVPDAQGEVRERLTIPYEFTSKGPHSIAIFLRRGSEELSLEEIVVVNDPSRIEVSGQASVPSTHFDDAFIGIAVDRTGQSIFVGGLRQNDLPIYMFDAAPLTVSDSAKLSLRSNPEGLSAAPDEDRLYVAGRGFDLTVLSTPKLGKLEYFEQVAGQFAVIAIPNRRAYVGGLGLGEEIALIDTDTGIVLAAFNPGGDYQSRNFALSPDGSRIAFPVISEAQPDELILLGAEALVPIWRINLDATDPPDLSGVVVRLTDGVGFSADGRRIYVIRLFHGGPGQMDFLVFDVSDGRLIRRVTLDTGCAFFSCKSGPNAVANSSDGRFAAFSTFRGAFFIDRVLDLPLYRTPLNESARYCCDVAANPVVNEFYFNSLFEERLTKVRLRP